MDPDLKILIVEDVPKDADEMEAALREEGLRFQSRRLDGRAGFLRTLEEFSPDIVLSDFTLPDFDALEALRLLKEHQYDIPLILVTGSRSEEVAVECIKEGAADYILKASLKRLPSSVIHVLEKKAAEKLRHQAEAALRESERLFRLITENSHDLISLLDVKGHFLYASPAFAQKLGYVPEELIGTPLRDLVHPDDQNILDRGLQEALVHQVGSTAEYRFKPQRGDWLVFESTGNWVFDERGKPQRAVVVSRDIGQRKQTEALLRALPRLTREAQEAERRRVARELHDSVNQMLASVKFRMESLEEKLLDHDQAAWRESLKAKALLDKAMQEVRRISRNLRPSELDDLGLVPAVRSLCKELSDRTGLKIDLDLRQLPEKVNPDFELNLYRIIQEALNNIEKHAQATQVAVSASRQNRWLQIRIRDNGCGFDPRSHPPKQGEVTGMGMGDMQERASFFGGRCAIASTAGSGTEVSLHIPLSPLKSAPKNGRKEREES